MVVSVDLSRGSCSFPRRKFLLGTAFLLVNTGAASAAPKRIATLGYETAQTALSLGAVPLAATNPDGYAEWGGFPPLPSAVANIGLRTEPNLEYLQQLEPDLILVTEGENWSRALLEKIAPTASFRMFVVEGSPLENARTALNEVADRLGRKEQAARLIDDLGRGVEKLAKTTIETNPTFLMTSIDERHLYVYGETSLFGNVWRALGRRNAWRRRVNRWGFAIIGPEALAEVPKANLLHIGRWNSHLAEHPLWSAMGYGDPARLKVIDPVLPFGGVPSALRFLSMLDNSGEPSR